MKREKELKETINAINKYFPKGNKQRGDAMVIAGISRIEGREEMRDLILRDLEKNGDKK